MQKRYSEKMCKDVRKYFASYVGYWDRRVEEIEKKYLGEDETAVVERTAAFKRLYDEMMVKERMRGLPSLQKWAKKIGVDPSTVSRWQREYPEFAQACRDCMAVQDDILRDGGLGSLYASRVVTFLLEMNERRAKEIDQTTGGMRFEDFDDEEDGGGA